MLVDAGPSAQPEQPEQPPRVGCRSSACEAGQVCDHLSGGCVRVDPGRCGLPTPSTGSSVDGCSWDGGSCAPYTVCAPGGCAPGLVCAPNDFRLDPVTNTYQARSGRCLPACDPCSAACENAMECVALPERGGYCNPGPLALAGESCRIGTCSGRNSCFAGVCRSNCRPEVSGAPPSGQYVGFRSADCGEAQLCSWLTQDGHGDVFECRGPRTPVGELCIGPCEWPASCRATLWTSTLDLICSPNCLEAPCPPGVGCFAVAGPGLANPVRQVCIRDHLLAVNAPCAEDRNCTAWLRCLSADGGLRTCQYP